MTALPQKEHPKGPMHRPGKLQEVQGGLKEDEQREKIELEEKLKTFLYFVRNAI